MLDLGHAQKALNATAFVYISTQNLLNLDLLALQGPKTASKLLWSVTTGLNGVRTWETVCRLGMSQPLRS